MSMVQIAVVAALAAAAQAREDAPGALPTLAEVVRARADLWGEAALRQPDGPSFEFFRDLLPPLRYVNADFRDYPIVLSAPRALRKARLISNGRGVNLRGGARSWRDTGLPFTFRVGPDEYRFGELSDRLQGPSLEEGYLPIVEIRYGHPSPVRHAGSLPIDQVPEPRESEVYRLEAFAATEPALAEHAVVLVRFSLAAGETGIITAQPEAALGLAFHDGSITDEAGKIVALCDPSWKWERNSAHAQLKPGTAAVIAIASHPLEPEARFALSSAVFENQRTHARRTWREILDGGMNVEVPEPYVNNAWRNLLIQNYGLLKGDRIHYSAGNQYDQLYEGEGSEAAQAMLAWGHADEYRRMLVPLLDFTRKGLEYHQAGYKLRDVCQYYWMTHDAEILRAERPRWSKEVERILSARDPEHGLLPREQYCGDITTPVMSLCSNAKAWRGLRDLAAILDETGDRAEAARLRRAAAEYREHILAALQRSLRRETSPPFAPMALLANEAIHDPITATRLGSYWNLVVGYAISSGLFPPGSEREAWIPNYLQEHGGLCMGLIRCGGLAPTFWTSAQRIDPLYGTGYTVDALRRDDPERALVSFYGMLAHGLTRDTFIGGEGCDLAPVDAHGRFFYCPPNSASNGFVLTMLRYLLVQDFDLDDDGVPETLRLLHGTPRRWLADGRTLRVERAPTAFGPLSIVVHSRLSQGEVTAEAELPGRNPPKSARLRIRLPEGWRVVSAEAAGRDCRVDPQGTLQLPVQSGKVRVRLAVRKDD